MSIEALGKAVFRLRKTPCGPLRGAPIRISPSLSFPASSIFDAEARLIGSPRGEVGPAIEAQGRRAARPGELQRCDRTLTVQVNLHRLQVELVKRAEQGSVRVSASLGEAPAAFHDAVERMVTELGWFLDEHIAGGTIITSERSGSVTTGGIPMASRNGGTNAAGVLGIRLGGLVDGILLLQIFQDHAMLSARVPLDSMETSC